MIGSTTVCYFKVLIAAKPAITASSAFVSPVHQRNNRTSTRFNPFCGYPGNAGIPTGIFLSQSGSQLGEVRRVSASAADTGGFCFMFLISPQVQWQYARSPRTRDIPGLHAFTMPRSNDKRRIIEHYDVLSPYYRSLWGEHLHHGYWIRGDESKEKAQHQLIEHLAQLARVKPGSDILDIGCGFGASSLYLAKNFNAAVTGITISPVQVEMAAKAAASEKLDAKFLLMDAEAMHFQKQFDLLWSVESISHYQRREEFFASAAKLLKPGGLFAITDWFKKENLTPAETRKFIHPIEKGMLVELQNMHDYERFLTSNGLQIMHREILNENCAKTWDLCLDIIGDKAFWALAVKLGAAFVSYLKAFQAMRAGFASGNFVYGLFVACASSSASATSNAR
jgi:tocopherol O-methyltransferase